MKRNKVSYKHLPWKTYAPQELEALNSLEYGLDLIFTELPRKKIISIYLGGSFLRREMTPDSDVDIWVIVKENKDLHSVERLAKAHWDDVKPAISIGSRSLQELMSGKKALVHANKHGSSRFVKQLPHLHLLYGKKLDIKVFKTKPDAIDLADHLLTFRNKFIPLWRQKRFGFGQLLNQVFWLVEMDLRVHGEKTKYSWKHLIQRIKDRKHIVHHAWRLRNHPTKSLKKHHEFVHRLEGYIESLENRVRRGEFLSKDMKQ